MWIILFIFLCGFFFMSFYVNNFCSLRNSLSLTLRLKFLPNFCIGLIKSFLTIRDIAKSSTISKNWYREKAHYTAFNFCDYDVEIISQYFHTKSMRKIILRDYNKKLTEKDIKYVANNFTNV